ncbi:MAG: helix-turn-helix domain-containing protein [Haloferacaceae archaeon]
MVLSTDVYVEHPDMALVPTIRACPEATIRVVSDAGTDPKRDVNYFRIESSDFESIEAALADDHTVADFSVIVEKTDRRIYGIEYSRDAVLITPSVLDIGGLTMASCSNSNGWLLELQLADHDALYALSEYASERGIQLEVLKLDHTEKDYDRRDYGLTERQNEALLAAYVNGYYDDPRKTSLEGLTEYLGISPTATSGRLRRASAQLIEAVLVDDRDS